jgi:type IV pilus biogenesis protein CpaD/CtpE
MRSSLGRAYTLRLLSALLLIAQVACIDRSGLRVAPTAALPCPAWVEFPADGHSNEDSIYLGCTNAENLHNMVADPGDLAQGRALGPASGERETLGVDRYNHGRINASKSAPSASPTIIMPNSDSEMPP